ncbi:MAG TPA: hypothetical protein VMT29_08980 [Steroidobacteraceae bacterium]|nr:hypothetical protein [Steroidobacteraceae bacterium]
MMRHILRKDWALLWPLALLVIAIQVGLEWSLFRTGLQATNTLALELSRFLRTAWNLGIVALTIAVVHEDTIPGSDQDWLIRPVPRTSLMLAKMVFVTVTICVPMWIVNIAHELALGFPVLPSLVDALYKECYVFLCLLLPVMALASIARNMTELLVLGAGFAVLFAVSEGVGALLLGDSLCPTCESGLFWLQRQVQHVGLLMGAVIILALQYYRRSTTTSRIVAAVGVVLLVFVQLPWGSAFALQRIVTGPAGSAGTALLTIDPAAVAVKTSLRTSNAARRASLNLMSGNVAGAVESLRQVKAKDAPVELSAPLRISGLAPGNFLLADRLTLTLIRSNEVLYQGVVQQPRTWPLISEPAGGGPDSGSVPQKVTVPAAELTAVTEHGGRLVFRYWLTRMSLSAEHRMPAMDGELRAADVGLCRARVDSDAIRIRCQRIGRAPNCYIATLYGPDGTHNAPVLECMADYRPYIPSLADILSYAGMDLPIRDPAGVAHYPVESAALPEAHILLQVFTPREHFTRSVDLARQ